MTKTSDTNLDKPLGPAFYAGLALMLSSHVGLIAISLYLMSIPFYWWGIINLLCLLTCLLATRLDRRISQNAYPWISAVLVFICPTTFIFLAFALVPRSVWDFLQLEPVGAAIACFIAVSMLPEWFGILKTIASNQPTMEPPLIPHDASQASNPYALPMLANPQVSDASLESDVSPEQT
jgi:hypothetical protein